MIRCTGLLHNPSPDKDNKIISITSPDEANTPFPKTGLNLLYGKTTLDEFRDISEDLCRIHSDSAPKLEMVEISCLGLRKSSDVHWFDSYQNKNVFDMRRLSAAPRPEIEGHKSIKDEILEFFAERAINDYGIDELIKSGCISNRTREVSAAILERYPMYIDDMRSEMKWMENIELLIWSAKVGGTFDTTTKTWTGPVRSLTRATLFNSKCVIMMTPHDPIYPIAPLDVPATVTPLTMRRVKRSLAES